MRKPPDNRRSSPLPPATACAGCGCTEARACEGGCYWAYPPRRNRPLVCSNCIYPKSRRQATLATRFPQGHRVHWIHAIGLMGVLGPSGAVVRTAARRVLIRLDEERTEHWVSPRRLLDADPFEGPRADAKAA